MLEATASGNAIISAKELPVLGEKQYAKVSKQSVYNGMVAQPAGRTLVAESMLSGAKIAGGPGQLTGGFYPG